MHGKHLPKSHGAWCVSPKCLPLTANSLPRRASWAGGLFWAAQLGPGIRMNGLQVAKKRKNSNSINRLNFAPQATTCLTSTAVDYIATHKSLHKRVCNEDAVTSAMQVGIDGIHRRTKFLSGREIGGGNSPIISLRLAWMPDTIASSARSLSARPNGSSSSSLRASRAKKV